MDEPSDDHLMRAYAAGDGAAFERLYARHQAALYRFVRRLLGTAAASQADEVFQDTWLRAIQARHSWQPQGASFRTWLFTFVPVGLVLALPWLRRRSVAALPAAPQEAA